MPCGPASPAPPWSPPPRLLSTEINISAPTLDGHTPASIACLQPELSMLPSVCPRLKLELSTLRSLPGPSLGKPVHIVQVIPLSGPGKELLV